jgi:hypothetical protein
MTTRTEQELSALKDVGRDLDKPLSALEINALEILTLAVSAESYRTEAPTRPALTEVARKVCLDVHSYLSRTTHDELRTLIAAAELLGMQRAADDPATVRKQRLRRRRLKTPQQICNAIAEVTADLEMNTITPASARARLYALQTLLVAMKMHPADPRGEILPGASIRELQAAQENDD